MAENKAPWHFSYDKSNHKLTYVIGSALKHDAHDVLPGLLQMLYVAGKLAKENEPLPESIPPFRAGASSSIGTLELPEADTEALIAKANVNTENPEYSIMQECARAAYGIYNRIAPGVLQQNSLEFTPPEVFFAQCAEIRKELPKETPPMLPVLAASVALMAREHGDNIQEMLKPIFAQWKAQKNAASICNSAIGRVEEDQRMGEKKFRWGDMELNALCRAEQDQLTVMITMPKGLNAAAQSLATALCCQMLAKTAEKREAAVDIRRHEEQEKRLSLSFTIDLPKDKPPIHPYTIATWAKEALNTMDYYLKQDMPLEDAAKETCKQYEQTCLRVLQKHDSSLNHPSQIHGKHITYGDPSESAPLASCGHDTEYAAFPKAKEKPEPDKEKAEALFRETLEGAWPKSAADFFYLKGAAHGHKGQYPIPERLKVAGLFLAFREELLDACANRLAEIYFQGRPPHGLENPNPVVPLGCIEELLMDALRNAAGEEAAKPYAPFARTFNERHAPLCVQAAREAGLKEPYDWSKPDSRLFISAPRARG